MNKVAVSAIAMSLLLAACEGHQYERSTPGVTVSGEAGFGVVYEDGKTKPHTTTTVSVSMGGSL
ncbi:hypothetical protein ALP8811_00682 [Aliiroseovarius pelagivivens]|uniref:Lipoprotein n=1 Tax=Aliiroseovarius pelagivivens TaxID=1639690 RepID=A0A2R8AIH7_9RHOB|nr:hypothetical protein [Aliiroseovarius pelagivivens]SPF75689.1 hypothetical protein ALP8811_00682 [Aliiroseovarius pelagivivens]